MADSNNRESKKYNITHNKDINNNYWINELLTWWSGFSLSKLLNKLVIPLSFIPQGIIFLY